MITRATFLFSIPCVLSLFTIMSLSLVSSATADSPQHYIGRSRTPLCSSPGGPRLGELYVNAPVSVVEEKGDWVKVSLEGWVRKSILSKSSGARVGSDGSLVEKGDTNLSIESYQIERKPTDTKSRALLTLKLRNNTQKVVRSWRALLVAQSKKGNVLFREPITENGVEIAPGQLHEVAFYWSQGEVPFDVLLTQDKQDLQLKFFRVTLK